MKKNLGGLTFALALVAATSLQAATGAELLHTYLVRAQSNSAAFDITYNFVVDVQALGKTSYEQSSLRSVGGDAPFVIAQGASPVKIDVAGNSQCVKQGEDWQCHPLSPGQLTANLANAQMSLYPPTAMTLLAQLIELHPDAVAIAAAGSRHVAGRDCDSFRVMLNAAQLPREAYPSHLFVRVETDQTTPYVIGTTLDLCFDRLNGQVLDYQNELVLDQSRMRADGLTSGFSEEAGAVTDSMGTIRARLVAQRVQ